MVKKRKSTIKTWWLYLLIGAIILVIGGNFLAKPTATLGAISEIVGFYFTFEGATGLMTTIINKKYNNKWLVHIILKIIICLCGVLMVVQPQFVSSTMWLFCGIAFIAEGTTAILTAIDIKKAQISGWIASMIFGIIICILALIILLNPIIKIDLSGIIVSWAIIIYGAYLVVFAHQIK